MNKIKITILLITLTLIVISCINPLYPKQQYLQHIGTILLLIPLIIDIKRNELSIYAFIGIIIFTLLHTIGARYIYSYVPYKDWLISYGIIGEDYFQDTRNHYDRLVHFSFGLLLFPYFVIICKKWFKQKTSIAIFMAWLMIQSCSMIYELFEWLLTIVMTSEEADYYNGQQGDIWDAQKDMVLAMMGSTIMAILYLIRYKMTRYSKDFSNKTININ